MNATRLEEPVNKPSLELVTVDALMPEPPPPPPARDLLSLISERAVSEANRGDATLLRFVIEHSDLKQEFRELVAELQRKERLIMELKRKASPNRFERVITSRDDARRACEVYRVRLREQTARVAELEAELLDVVGDDEIEPIQVVPCD